MRWTTVLLCVVVMSLSGGFAAAAQIKCHVTQAGVDVPGALVTLYPGGASHNTDANGVCLFDGLPAGTYSVIAEKTIGGVLHGAVTDDFALGATEAKSLSLAMTHAIRMHEYLPLNVGNFWQYRTQRRGVTGTSTGTRYERTVGTDTIDGDQVTVIEVTWAGSTDGMKMYWRADPRGFGVYREAQTANTIDYVPPMKLPRLLPLGHVFRHEGRIKHSSGAPDNHVKMEARIAGFDAITVPAGSFADCPRLEAVISVDGREDHNVMWMALGVGTVRSYEKNDEREYRRSLEEYSIARRRPLPLPPPLRPLPRPERP